MKKTTRIIILTCLLLSSCLSVLSYINEPCPTIYSISFGNIENIYLQSKQVNINGYLIFEINKNISDKDIHKGSFKSNIYWIDNLEKPNYKYYYNSYQLSYDIYLNKQYYIYNRFDSTKFRIYNQNKSEFWKFGENKEPFFIQEFSDWWDNFSNDKNINESIFLRHPFCTNIFENSYLWSKPDNDTLAYYIFNCYVDGAIIQIQVNNMDSNIELKSFENILIAPTDCFQIFIPTTKVYYFSSTLSSEIIASGLKLSNWKPVINYE